LINAFLFLEICSHKFSRYDFTFTLIEDAEYVEDGELLSINLWQRQSFALGLEIGQQFVGKRKIHPPRFSTLSYFYEDHFFA